MRKAKENMSNNHSYLVIGVCHGFTLNRVVPDTWLPQNIAIYIAKQVKIDLKDLNEVFIIKDSTVIHHLSNEES